MRDKESDCDSDSDSDSPYLLLCWQYSAPLSGWKAVDMAACTPSHDPSTCKGMRNGNVYNNDGLMRYNTVITHQQQTKDAVQIALAHQHSTSAQQNTG